MILLGLLSLVQIGFLPGFLLLRALRLRVGLAATLLYAFVLSLVCNYVGVALLTALHAYRATTVYVIVAVELVCLLRVAQRGIQALLGGRLSQGLAHLAHRGARLLPDDGDALGLSEALRRHKRVVALWQVALCVLCLVWPVKVLLVLFIPAMGMVFTGWDAVVSWNRWAVDWSLNRFPVHPQHYPQLLTANWSLAYVMMQAPLQFIPKLLMPVFPAAIMLASWDLWAQSRRLAWLVAAGIIPILLHNALGGVLVDGYAEGPVAALAFLAVYAIVKASLDRDRAMTHLALGAVAAAGAAVTKQAGVFMLAAWPVLVALLVIRGDAGRWPAWRWRRGVAAYAVLILVVCVPFFAWTQWRIHRGEESSEIAYVTHGIHQDRTVADRVARGSLRLADGLAGTRTVQDVFADGAASTGTVRDVLCGHPLQAARMLAVGGLVVLLMTCGLGDRTWRCLGLTVCLPYLLIWLVFFSYDIRNCALALPLIGVGVGFGVECVLTGAVPTVHRAAGRVRGWVILLAVAGLLLALTGIVKDPRIKHRHELQQRRIGNSGLNAALYRWREEHGLDGKIVTDYQLLAYLPGMEGLSVYHGFESRDPGQLRHFEEAVAGADVGYVLVPDYAVPAVREVIDRRVAAGEWRVCFTESGCTLIRISRPQKDTGR